MTNPGICSWPGAVDVLIDDRALLTSVLERRESRKLEAMSQRNGTVGVLGVVAWTTDAK